jgi:hypothetical protein
MYRLGMIRWLLSSVACATALLAASTAMSQGNNALEVVTVTGRLPGPPLWRVSNGDRRLYIFGTFSPVPDGMIWESDRVARVLEGSQEVIFAPDIDADFSLGLMLNPVNLFRGRRLSKRLTRLPDDATLDEIVPAELYDRYAALRSRYFPREDDPVRERPLVAGTRLAERIQREEGLVSSKQVTKPLNRLIKRNRHLQQTRVEVVVSLKGSFTSLARRAETLMGSLSPEKELACFAEQLRRMESELDAMKSRANAWAQGYVDEFRGIPLPGSDDDACFLLLLESSEFSTIEQVRSELDARWLAAADRALTTNESTFAILDIVDLTREDGLLAALRTRGYEIWEP